MKTYDELSKINVNEWIEKKGKLSYLSWVWAVDLLLRHDENATWEYDPPVMFGETVMVFCAVTAFGRTRKAQLPVMNHLNKSVANPDSFSVNTAMQRCLAKAIALHGIGLYIYAGEDLPAGAEPEPEVEDPRKAEVMADLTLVAKEGGMEALAEAWKATLPADRELVGKDGIAALKAIAG